MATSTRMVFIVASLVVVSAAAAWGIDFDTAGVVVMLAGLLGMLFSLVWWDSWQPEERRADDHGRVAANPVPGHTSASNVQRRVVR